MLSQMNESLIRQSYFYRKAFCSFCAVTSISASKQRVDSILNTIRRHPFDIPSSQFATIASLSVANANDSGRRPSDGTLLVHYVGVFGQDPDSQSTPSRLSRCAMLLAFVISWRLLRDVGLLLPSLRSLSTSVYLLPSRVYLRRPLCSESCAPYKISKS